MKRTPFPLLPPIKYNTVSQNLMEVQFQDLPKGINSKKKFILVFEVQLVLHYWDLN